jgi:5'-3' exonuclease
LPNILANAKADVLDPVQVEESSKKRTLLIDASPLIYRAFHGVPALDKGTPLNAVYGFLRTLLKLMRENKFDNLGT